MGSDNEVTYLPRGVWYEPSRDRYRVRLYRNHKTYRAGYFDNLEDALKAFEELREMVNKIPKNKRNYRSSGRVPQANDVADMLRAAKEDEI